MIDLRIGVHPNHAIAGRALRRWRTLCRRVALAQPELAEIALALAQQLVPEQVRQPSKAAGSIPTSPLAMARWTQPERCPLS